VDDVRRRDPEGREDRRRREDEDLLDAEVAGVPDGVDRARAAERVQDEVLGMAAALG
jgi:hypothetical protein